MLLRLRIFLKIHREALSAIALLLIVVFAIIFEIGSIYGFRHHFDPNFFEVSEIAPLEDGGVVLSVWLVDDPEITIDLPVTSEVAKNRALKVGWRYHIDYRIGNNGEYIVTNIN